MRLRIKTEVKRDKQDQRCSSSFNVVGCDASRSNRNSGSNPGVVLLYKDGMLGEGEARV